MFNYDPPSHYYGLDDYDLPKRLRLTAKRKPTSVEAKVRRSQAKRSRRANRPRK